jgi:CheY-like chemotaxis protein
LLCELLKLEPITQLPINGRESAPAIPPCSPEAGDSQATSADTDLLDAVFAMLSSDAQTAKTSATSGDLPKDVTRWILHIEDDQDLSAALSLRLRPYGISVIRAFAGMEGYRRAFLNPADAIILDYELPNGNGDYVMRRLKENPVTKDIPVIILTGRKERTVERKMRNLGADAFLNKPLEFNSLIDELERLVGLRRERVGSKKGQLVGT